MAVLAREVLGIRYDLTQFVHHDVSSMAGTDELHGLEPRVERSNGEATTKDVLLRHDVWRINKFARV